MAVWAGVPMVALKCGTHSEDVPGSRRLGELTLKRNRSLSHEASTMRKWTFISVSCGALRAQLPPAPSSSPQSHVRAVRHPTEAGERPSVDLSERRTRLPVSPASFS